MQDGLASVARDSTIRLCSLLPRNRHLSVVLRRAPHSAPALAFGGLVPPCRCAGRVDGPCSGFRTRTLEWDLDAAVARAVLSARAHPRSLSVSASMVPTEVTSPSASGSLSGAPREPNVSSSFTSLPTADSGAPCNESSQQNTRSLSTTLAFISHRAVWIFCSPCSGISNSSPLMSAPAKPFEGVAPEWSRCARNLLNRALSGRPAWSNATSSSSLQGFPIPARQRPLVGSGRQLPNTSCRQRSQQYGAPQREAVRGFTRQPENSKRAHLRAKTSHQKRGKRE